MVFRNTLFLFLFLSSVNFSFSQWMKLDFSEKRNTYSIFMTEESTYIGTDEKIFYKKEQDDTWEQTTVEGKGYNISDFCFNRINGIIVENDKWIASGLAVDGQGVVIPIKKPGYEKWSNGFVTTSGGYPMFINEMKVINGKYYAISSNGFFYEYEKDSFWSKIPLYGKNLITMTNSGSNFLVFSSNRVYYSTDGAQTFNPSSYFKNNIVWGEYINDTTAILATDKGGLMTSTNFGSTWALLDINLPSQYVFEKFNFLTKDTVYAFSNNVFLRSIDGGKNWDKQTFDFKINNFGFKNRNEGYLLGDSGNVLYTDNGGGEFFPVANFKSSNNKYCVDSLIELVSQSPSAEGYQWFHNGKFKSGEIKFNFVANNLSQDDTVKLVVNKGAVYDTIQKIFSIEPSLDIGVKYVLDKDSVCIGNRNTVILKESSRTATYWVTDSDSSYVSDTRLGASYDIRLLTGIIKGDEIYRLHLINSVEGCGSFYKELPVYIPNGSPDRTLNVYSNPPVICPNEKATIMVENSQPNIEYQLYSGYSKVGKAVEGTGGTISFEEDNYLSDPQYKVFAFNADRYCRIDLFDTVSVKVEQPKAHFALNDLNITSDQNLEIKNTSKNEDGTYQWSFIPDGNPSISGNVEPDGITFKKVGKKNVQLVAISPIGCTDTIMQSLNVITKKTADECLVTQFETSKYDGGIESLVYDNDGNLFVGTSTFGELREGDYSKIYTSEEDVVEDVFNHDYRYKYNYENYIFKLDVNGQVIWKTKFTCGSTWNKDARLSTDKEGNLYMVYFHSDYLDSVRFYSVDGTYQNYKAKPPCELNCHNGDQTFFVVKWDSNGFLQWVNYFHDQYTASGWNDRQPIFVDDNELYIGTPRNFVIYKLNGETVFRSRTLAPDNGGICALFKSGKSDGNVMAVRSGGFIFEEYDSLGNRISKVKTVEKVNDSETRTYIYNRYVQRDEEAIYIAGDFSGKFIFLGDTISDIYTGGSLHHDSYLAKFSLKGEPIWIKHFVSNQGDSHFLNGLAVSDENIYLYMDGRGDLVLPDGPSYNTDESQHILIVLNKEGDISEYGMPFKGVSQAEGRGKDNFIYNSNNGKLAFFQRFTEDFQLGDRVINKGNSPRNYVIVQVVADSDCLDFTDLITESRLHSNSSNAFDLYPNPAKSILSIKLKDQSDINDVKLINSNGIEHEISYSINEKGLQLDVTNLSPGVYLIRIHQNGEQYIGKFVKD